MTLSTAQEAIWYEEQLQSGTSNTGFFSVTITGDVAETAIWAACEAIVDRHPPLRTLVRFDGDQPVLDVRPPGRPLHFDPADAPCPSGAEIPATRAWRDAHGTRSFDLTTEPGVAFTLLRHAPGRQTLLVVVHHFCFDGRSKFLFARDFVTALGGTELAPLPPVDTPLPDAELLERARKHWDALDVPAIPCLNLPTASTSEAGGAGTTPGFVLNRAQRSRLGELAANAGTSLFGGLLAGLATQLHCYGNERMVLCVPVDLSTPESRGHIELAINVVPVELTVRGDDTFRTVLDAARSALAQLKEFRRVPFRQLAGGKPWASGARALFSKVSLSYLRLPDDIPGIPGLDLQWDFVAPNSAQSFDLMFHLRDVGQNIVGRLDYACRILDRAAATAMADHFQAVLNRAIAEPDTPLRALAPLVPASVAGSLASAPDPGVGAAAGAGNSAAPLDWLPGLAGDVLQLAEPGTPEHALEAWLARVSGGALHAHRGVRPVDSDAVRAAVAEHGLTTLVAPYRLIEEVVGAGAGTLTDLVTPVSQVRPSAALAALLGAGVRLHALYAPAGLRPIAVQTCGPADLGDRPPVLRSVAPGVRLEVCGPDGVGLPRGVAGEIVVDMDGIRIRTGDRGRVEDHLTFFGAAADTVHWAGLSLNIPSLERYLATHPAVESATVTVDGSRVTAIATGRGLDARQLRLHLKRRSVSDELRVGTIILEEP